MTGRAGERGILASRLQHSVGMAAVAGLNVSLLIGRDHVMGGPDASCGRALGDTTGRYPLRDQ